MATKKKKADKAEVAKGYESYEAASEAKGTITKGISAARAELRDFMKDNGLKKAKDYSADKKHGKAFTKLTAAVEELETARKEAIQFMKDNKKKGKSGGGGSSAKYEYPKEVLEAEDVGLAKKKFRTSTRTKANRAGVTVAEYLADPTKYADVKKEKPAKKAKKAKDEEEEEKPAKKAAKKGKGKKEEAPAEKPSKKPAKKKKAAED